MVILARELGSRFIPLAELWLPTLLKQVAAVSTQLMSSAANKGVLAVIGLADVGFSKGLTLLVEGCNSKSPVLRQHAYNYVAMCVSLWSPEVVDR